MGAQGSGVRFLAYLAREIQEAPWEETFGLSPIGPVFTRRTREKRVLGGIAPTKLQDLCRVSPKF